jgi:hypothetical protein
MWKERLTVNFSLVLIFLVSGCAVRSVYIPVSQNAPLFGKNKSIQLNAYPGTNHMEVQAAYNPGKHFAMAGNINFGSGFSIYDAAVGWYGYGNSEHWRAESFIGYGYNSNIAMQTANYNSILQKPISNYEIYSLYDKYYFQPSAGYFNEIKMYKMKYSFALSARLSALYFKTYSFKEIDADATQATSQTVYLKNKVYENKTLYLLEPCFINRVGVRNIYAILQGQFFIPYSDQIDVSYTKFSQGFLLSLGLQYVINFKPHGDAKKN